LENEREGRKDVYNALESELGRCSEGNESWRRIYYQAFIARKIYETYRESLGIKTGVLVDHWAILIKNESDVDPFTEKDINCYLYAMKFRGNDSLNVLEKIIHVANPLLSLSNVLSIYMFMQLFNIPLYAIPYRYRWYHLRLFQEDRSHTQNYLFQSMLHM
jgi:hypothetical protein